MNIAKMIPFMDDEELKLLVDKIIENPNGEYKGIKLTSILPFLDEEDVDRLFVNEIKNGRYNASFAPFCSDEVWSKIIDEVIDSNQGGKLVPFLPFMNDEDISKLASKIKDGTIKGISFQAILPFMDDDDVDDLIIKTAEDGEDITSYAPFASDDCLDKLCDQYIEGKLPNLNVDALYPFMDDSTIKKLFKHEINKQD